MKVYQHLRAPNDSNGNPRRLWAIYEVASRSVTSRIVKVIDEGYGGRPDCVRKLVELPSIDITLGDYKEWIRVAKSEGVFVNS